MARERFSDSRPYLYDPAFWRARTTADHAQADDARQHHPYPPTPYRGTIRDTQAKRWVPCHRCGGLGKIVYPVADGEDIVTRCPRCQGRKKIMAYPQYS